MPTAKGKKAATPKAASQEAPAPNLMAAFFPYARYISIVGVHCSLLAFVALFLPRAAFADFASPAVARARPKRDGMVMLTETPLRTVGWMVFGALILQAWWGSWMRHWALDAIHSLEMREKDEKEKGLTIATRAGKGGLEASLGMEGDEAI